MAPHSSTLAWKIPWTEEPGGLQSMGSLRVGHDWATSLSLFTFMHWRRKWQPTTVFLPGESRDGGAWWAAVSGVAQSRTRLKRLSSSSSSLVITALFFFSESQRLVFFKYSSNLPEEIFGIFCSIVLKMQDRTRWFELFKIFNPINVVILNIVMNYLGCFSPHPISRLSTATHLLRFWI